jgi:hypothetical protein
MKQLILDSKIFKSPPREFGGVLLNGRRKSLRPLSLKEPMHLVLRANIKKSGSLLKHRGAIIRTIDKFNKRFKVKDYQKAIVANHLHLLIQFSSREEYKAWVRSVTGQLAQKLSINWSLRPFTRIVTWGRDFKRVKDYIFQNRLEALGVIHYRPRVKPKITGPPKFT